MPEFFNSLRHKPTLEAIKLKDITVVNLYDSTYLSNYTNSNNSIVIQSDCIVSPVTIPDFKGVATMDKSTVSDGSYLKQELYDLFSDNPFIFDFIQQSTLDGIWYWDIENPEYEWLSPEFWELLGYDPATKKHLASEWQDLIHSDDLEIAIDNFTKHCEDPSHPYDQIVRYRHKDGSTVWVRCRGMAVRNADGVPTRMLGAHNDITELKKAEETLLKSEERHRRTVAGSNDGLWEWNIQTDHEYISPRYKEILGFQPHELKNERNDFLKLVHADDVDRFEQNLKNHLENGSPYDLKFRLRHRQGHFIWVRSRAQTFRDENGDPLYMSGALTDITEQKVTENNLLDQQRRMDIALDTAKVGTWDWNISDDTHTNDEHWGQLFGLSQDQLKTVSMDTIYNSLHPDDVDVIKDAIDKALKGEKTYDVDYRVIWPDGSVHWINSRADVFRDKDGSPQRMVGAGVDITERKLTDERLRQMQKMDAIGQISGGMAHEFNNLLTVIIGNLSILSDQLKRNPAIIERIEKIKGAAKRGANVTSQLLSYSRRQPLEPEEHSIKQLVVSQIQMLHATLGERVSLRTTFDDDGWTVKLDPDAFGSAILNLALNAKHAMSDHGLLTFTTKIVHVAEGENVEETKIGAGNYIVLTVADKGSGMTPEVLEKAIEPFYTTKGRGEGSGLGLSMVQGFVEQSGGHLVMESEHGKGTSIRMYFPATEGTLKEEIKPTETPITFKTDQKTILVVEDDPDVLETVTTILSSFSYQVLEAIDGLSALEVLNQNGGIDLVFSDVIMPGDMTGIELGHEITKQHPNVKFLLSSGYPEDSFDQNENPIVGFNFLAKPYAMEQLEEKIRETLYS